MEYPPPPQRQTNRALELPFEYNLTKIAIVILTNPFKCQITKGF